MKKTFVLDTNVLLHDPDALYAFQENRVVIPFVVLEEIDSQKRRQDDIGRNARVVARELDKLRLCGGLAEGVPLPSGGTIKIELNHQNLETVSLVLDSSKKDNRILAVAFHLSQCSEGRVVLVTKDLGLRVKADVMGVEVEDFYSDAVDYPKLYEGVGETELSAEEIDLLYKEGKLDLGSDFPAFPHQFFVVRNNGNQSHSALARYCKNHLCRLNHGESLNFGIQARNKEQKFALELLLDDRVKVVTLVGRAGTGKTLLALAVGLEKVVEQKSYSRLLVTRPVIPMGKDIGYLPGSKEEKLRPWMQPIFDNLEFLFSNRDPQARIIEHLIERGLLEMEALTYIRGRSIPGQFIICDEAQNLSPHMIKTLVTRVGEGAKIVFTGDPEQIDHPYLDASDSGLTYLIEKFKAEEIAGHVKLRKGERSKVAETGARLL